MRKIRIPFFRIFYSGTFTVLLVILLIVLCITPADLIYQTIYDDRLGNIFVVASVYAVTAILALFIFASRLYTNKTTLAAIPKSYIPIEDGEVGRHVRAEIIKNRQRSAIVAWESRPRDLRNSPGATQTDGSHVSEQDLTEKKSNTLSPSNPIITFPPTSPPWGLIVHPGWSAPSTSDFPSLQFEKVILELPHLIEAKAVSLAPPDAVFNFLDNFSNDSTVTHPPDPRVVALLQRPAAMGMREYLAHLEGLGLVNPPTLGAKFLARYEYCRFSTNAPTEREFRELMDVFAGILEGMVGVDFGLLDDEGEPDDEGDSSSLGSRGSVVRTLAAGNSAATRYASSSAASSLRSQGSVVRHGLGPGLRLTG